MNLTFGNVALIVGGAIALFLIILLGIFTADPDKLGKSIGIGAVVVVVLMIIAFLFASWYNTNTAAGIRNYKDFQSNLDNGIEREITITAEDGRQIYHYQGKIDVESDHEDNYIKFEREDGGREIIYYGITDTVLITEIK